MTAIASRHAIATTLFATIVTALVLSTADGQAQGERRLQPAAPEAVIHELPRVVVAGRVQGAAEPAIVELPRVVVSGRKVDATTVAGGASARVERQRAAS